MVNNTGHHVHRGRAMLFAALVLVTAAGCGGTLKQAALSVEPSVSHAEASGRAIAAALDSLAIPGLAGRQVRIVVQSDGYGADMLMTGASAMLVKRGAVTVTSGGAQAVDSEPDEMRVRLDELTVILDPADIDGRGLIRRTAAAVVTAEIADTGGVPRTYMGAGAFADRIARASMDDGTGIGHSPGIKGRAAGAASYVKPILIGIAMTVVAWSLFAYRG